ncbi:hypothetical protein [Ktedonospora formicarum]|uniref:Uncharacterized protein n=1 Tax=Ktedonospora formicarum TaxID=2778364 RepID=A0A8J3I7A6_9CHLR|nr:hypothetical protein [Ktedonospora formicarum]GHO47118.1 hypothetical protein KSX_52810 [Ktedonospora formicarum]
MTRVDFILDPSTPHFPPHLLAIDAITATVTPHTQYTVDVNKSNAGQPSDLRGRLAPFSLTPGSFLG